MGDAVTAKKGTINRGSYTVTGDTLEDIQNFLFDHQIPNSTDAVADCKTGVKTPAITKFNEEKAAKPSKKGTVEYTVTPKSGPKVELTATITLPKLGKNKLSSKAKAEWDRFLKKLTAHEDDHLDGAWKLAEKIAGELSALTGRGVGKDEKTALKKAKDDFKSQFDKGYSSSKVTALVKDVHKKLDGGGKNVFTLNINID